MKNNTTKLRNKCDKLIQLINKERYSFCLICGKPNQVGHHFIPKSVSARLRYDLENLIPLCNGCHIRLHQSGDPYYERRISDIKGSDWWTYLQETRKEIIKVNVGYYKNVLEELNNINV